MWVDTVWVSVVRVLGLLVEVLPEITDSSVHVVLVGVEVQVELFWAVVRLLHTLLTDSVMVRVFTFAPVILVAPTFEHTIVWVAVFWVYWWLFRWFFWVRWIAWVGDTASNVCPFTGVCWVVVVQTAVWAVFRMYMAGSTVPLVCILMGDARHELGTVVGVNVVAIVSL